MQFKKKLHIHWRADETQEDGGGFSYWEVDMSSLSNYTLLAVVDIDVEILDFDVRALMVDNLRATKAAIIQKATAETQRIDQRIEELLALTYEPA